MALVVGSIVSARVVGPQYTTGVQAQPPQFGVVSSTAGDPNFAVLWPDGHVEAAVLDDVLDEILSADPANIAAFAGRMVRHTRAASSSSDSNGFDGFVVMLYKRQPEGTGVVTGDLALVRTQTGFWMELPVAELEVVPGN